MRTSRTASAAPSPTFIPTSPTSRALTRDADARITDAAIWAYAREHGLVILTRDHDFTLLAREDEAAPPPHVVRLCLGNCRRQLIEQVLRDYHAEILAHTPPTFSLTVL